MSPHTPTLILASTSRYRRALLERLRLPFTASSPDLDETALPDEAPADMARRLAQSKAAAVAIAAGPRAWVLGSDQVADFQGTALGKPGDRDRAIAQLSLMSGRKVHFHTAIALVHRDGSRLEATDTTTVCFRTLSRAEISRYVDAETPFDCAGSFRCEGLGISLFEAIHSADPTALVGLPLIATCRLLRQAGFTLP